MLSPCVLSWIRGNILLPQRCFIGALPGTQCLDIGHSIQLIVEKSLHEKSQGCLAIADSCRYYVSLNLILISRYLVHKGCDPVTVAACVRGQVFVCVSLLLLSTARTRRIRIIGGSIGGRVVL